jgi:hypothetical protein
MVGAKTRSEVVVTINIETGTVEEQIPTEKTFGDRDAWPRRALDDERVAEFMGLYAEQGPDALPPIEVVRDGDGYLLADGWHRLSAQLRLSQASVRAVVLRLPTGRTPDEFAYERALETASKAAKPLTRTEKRAAIARLLGERPTASDRELSRLVGVDHKTVGSIRRRLGNSPEQPNLEDEPVGERNLAWLSADELALQLVRATDRLWQARGLGDMLFENRMGLRLAHALEEHHGEHARIWAIRLRDWGAVAFAELERSQGQG